MESFNAGWQFAAVMIAIPTYYIVVCGTSFVLAVRARKRSTQLHEGKFQGGATAGLVLSLALGAIAVGGGIVSAVTACKMLGGP